MKKIFIFLVFVLSFTIFGFYIFGFYSDYKMEKSIGEFLNDYKNGQDYNIQVQSLIDLKFSLTKKDNKFNNILVEKIDEKLKNLKNNYDTNSFLRIAHAGGGFNGKYYTNSLDSLEYNKPLFNLFEIDFSWTSDDKMVCQHYWKDDFKKNFGVDYEGPVSYQEFVELVEKNPNFKSCTLDSLVDWLNKNPNKYIVTDIKTDNIKGLTYIAENYPELKNNFIPQIYDPSEYEIVKNLGYEKIILTLYKYFGNKEKLFENIKGKNYFAITMDIGKVRDGWGETIKELGFYTYTHTINTKFDFDNYKKLGIDEIYTDFFVDDSNISKK